MGDALLALTLRIGFKELANLEEEHHEDCLRELMFGSRHESDAQCAKRCNGHEEVFVEGFSVCQSLCSFLERLVAYQ